MSSKSTILTPRDRRKNRRYFAKDFLFPRFYGVDAPKKAELLNISPDGLALTYIEGDRPLRNTIQIDLRGSEGMTLKNVRLEKVSDRKIDSQHSEFDKIWRGRFVNLSHTNKRKLNGVLFYGYVQKLKQHKTVETPARPEPPAPESGGILPICSSCRSVRDAGGHWHRIESYLKDHHGLIFSHGICPDCAKKLYPDLDIG